MSHPDKLPDLVLDSGLGRVKVPALLRVAGLRLVTLAEHYGIPEDETIADEEWLELAGTQGWVVFMKDTRIRYNVAERVAVNQHAVKAFCLSNQNLPGRVRRSGPSGGLARSTGRRARGRGAQDTGVARSMRI